MAKATKIPKLIMTPDEEQFMAFEGLAQWTQAVVIQSARVLAAQRTPDRTRHCPAHPRSVAKPSTAFMPNATSSPLPRTNCLNFETGF